MSDLQILWTPPEADSPLAAEAIHVWAAGLDLPPPSMALLEQTLSPEEKGRAGRFRFEEHRRRFIAARGALRQLLGEYLHEAPGAVELEYGVNGKPRLAGSSMLHFNVAHSGELALYAFTTASEVGIDLERLAFIPEADEIAARFFSSSEASAFSQMHDEQRDEFFFQCWTRKEALLKCAGAGLGVLETSRPADLPSGSNGTAKKTGDRAEESELFTLELHPARGYVAHLAAARAPLHLSTWLWTGDRIAEEGRFSRAYSTRQSHS
jgi:4'-phosphopantetheinyl transferase